MYILYLKVFADHPVDLSHRKSSQISNSYPGKFVRVDVVGNTGDNLTKESGQCHPKMRIGVVI